MYMNSNNQEQEASLMTVEHRGGSIKKVFLFLLE